jgi:AhpD family alkylhydroperoxidase
MEPRIANAHDLAPKQIKALYAASQAVLGGDLERSLIDLIHMRASQINGCAFCLAMHAAEAKAHGEQEVRLHLLPAWRETALFTPRERAALAWTEALTRVADTHAPDADYALVRDAFSEAEIVQLTVAIGMINLWNRLQIAVRAAPVIPAVAHAA